MKVDEVDVCNPSVVCYCTNHRGPFNKNMEWNGSHVYIGHV